MATQPLSTTSNQPAQVDLFPSPTTTDANFGSQRLPLGGRQFSQAMAQVSGRVGNGPYSPTVLNKKPIEMARPSNDQGSSRLQSGTGSLANIQNRAFVDDGAPFPLKSSKKQAQMDSLQKPQTALRLDSGPQHSSLKVQAEFESVRLKLRESLASALATGLKEQSNSKFLEKNSAGEEKCLLKKAEVFSLQNEIHPSAADASLSKNFSNRDGSQNLPSEVCSKGNLGDEKEADNISNVLHDHENDVQFTSHSIIKEELMQGHGICWESNIESMPSPVFKRFKLMNVEENIDTKGTSLQTYKHLSVKIEAELFKLFGGVNKKYKEKGRSLLFNLKDPSNPELRERVLSGDVSPERLCSMSAEELASKELSQWRQAKAEEFAQMVVLPDMNIDIRRLVRKTHKGEFQVEVEQDDGAHVEVGMGSDVIPSMLVKSNGEGQSQPRSNYKGLTLSRAHGLEISDDSPRGENIDSVGRNASSGLQQRFPEKTDYIHDFMVEELNDTELLPPVVSLDEFMEALDSEPPFDNLEIDNIQENASSVNRNVDRSESRSIHSHDCSGHVVDLTSDVSASKALGNSLDSQLHPDDAYAKQIIRIADSATNCNNMWEGYLQLNVSALSNVVSFFLSGEKTSMQEWPNLLEVKGRVRLDAFEKFLQELPLSRSRTIMLAEFRWKENSIESGRVHLSEAIHSYITDERLGFAEPAPGVELYLCPSHPKVTAILAAHLSKELLDGITRVVNGLIGIVVWRRPQAIISPRLSSHHKHGSGSKKHSSSKKRHGSTNHSNSNRNTLSMPHGNPIPHLDDEDDVPPGFGPPVLKEDDDLPEFDFSRGHSSRVAPPPAATALQSDHMRQLIQKYGQGENKVKELAIPVQPWNDDDDIPEWDPSQSSIQMPPQSGPSSSLPPFVAAPPPPPSLQLHAYQQHHRNAQTFAINPNQIPTQQPNAQFIQRPLHTPIPPQAGGVQPRPCAMWQPAAWGMPNGGVPLGGPLQPCHFGGGLSGGRPPGVGPRAVQGFGEVRNGSSSWTPDSFGSRGV